MLPPTVEMSRLAGSGAHHSAVFGQCGIEVAVQDAGLDHREQVIGPHLEDAVHAAHRQGDLAGPGVGAARQSGAGAARDDGRAGRARDAERLLHVGDGCGVHDRQRAAGCRVPRLVGPGVVPRRLRRVDAITESGAQQREDLDGVAHAKRRRLIRFAHAKRRRLIRFAHAKRRRPASTPAVTATTANTRPTQVSPMLHHARVAET